jgi:2'-5' RNA ligase
VQRDERLRLFCALRLPHDAREAIAAWQLAALPAGEVRHVAPANLHVTLAFLGTRPATDVDEILGALRAAAARAAVPVLGAGRYRETRSVGMVVLDDDEGRAAELAADLHARLEALGVYRPESRPWLPHVTVARFRRRPGLRIDPPGLGRFSPSDAALYNSVLRSGGAQYDVLESVALGG